MDFELVSNALPGAGAILRGASIDLEAGTTGTLSFDCSDEGQLAATMRLLTLDRPPAALGPNGERVYVRSIGDPDDGPLPRRVTIPVEVTDTPGPVTIGGS